MTITQDTKHHEGKTFYKDFYKGHGRAILEVGKFIVVKHFDMKGNYTGTTEGVIVSMTNHVNCETGAIHIYCIWEGEGGLRNAAGIGLDGQVVAVYK